MYARKQGHIYLQFPSFNSIHVLPNMSPLNFMFFLPPPLSCILASECSLYVHGYRPSLRAQKASQWEECKEEWGVCRPPPPRNYQEVLIALH